MERFFYRDTTLSESLILKYQVGQIITERGFTDMSTLGGGLSSNLRYLIASATARDVSAINPYAAGTGHVMLQSDAVFKVMDIYRVEGKTQIFLLEIEESEIEKLTIQAEKVLITKARQDFDILLTFPPEDTLQSPDWLERTEFPLGMSSDGKFFDVQ